MTRSAADVQLADTYYLVHACLRIYPGAMSPDDVTDRLGVTPTRVLRLGQAWVTARKTISYHKVNGWFLSSKGVLDSTDISEHLEWLLARIEPASNALDALMDEPDVRMDVYCTVEGKRRAVSCPILADHIRRFERLGVELAYFMPSYTEDAFDPAAAPAPPFSSPPISAEEREEEGFLEPHWYRQSAELHLTLDAIPPARVTHLLQVEPTVARRSGEPLERETRWSRHHDLPARVWILSSEDSISDESSDGFPAPIEAHLDWLVDQLEPCTEALLELLRRPGVSGLIYCACESDDAAIRLSLLPERLQRLARIGLSVEQFLYDYELE